MFENENSQSYFTTIKKTPDRRPRNKRIIVTDNRLKNSMEKIEILISHSKRAQRHEKFSEPRYGKLFVS
jgi:hypothetical protein